AGTGLPYISFPAAIHDRMMAVQGTLDMPIAISNRALLWVSVVCALLPPLSLASSLNLSVKVGEAAFFIVLGVLIPAIWLSTTIVYYRRAPTKNAKWLFALLPFALLYPLGGLALLIATLLKPGRW